MLYTSVKNYCDELVHHFDEISEERKLLLQRIAAFIDQKRKESSTIQLVYICTHNSRRSHFGQVWAAVAAAYFNIENVTPFSGGTEATAFNINAIDALNRIGFKIESDGATENPKHQVSFGDGLHTICFSKTYDDFANPKSDFAAIMTCGDAEANCPFIPNVALRIATTYNDPKAFDNTPQQNQQYDARCRQIALEILYAFSLVN